MTMVWRGLSAAKHCAQSMLRLRSADCNAGYVKMARILRGVRRGVRVAALALTLRYAILGTLRRMTAFADQSSARMYL